MRETIYTIPIHELFEPKAGCPLCRMRTLVEKRTVDYIMGAAMMEPDVREETNKTGFCSGHFEQMLACRNRLSLALMLESHLAEVRERAFEHKGRFGKSTPAEALGKFAESCFVCDRIRDGTRRLIKNLLHLWSKDEDFQKLFDEQEYLCLPHTAELLAASTKELPKKQAPVFAEHALALAQKQLDLVEGEVHTFCRSFDYRYAKEPAVREAVKDAPEKAIAFLVSETMEGVE